MNYSISNTRAFLIIIAFSTVVPAILILLGVCLGEWLVAL